MHAWGRGDRVGAGGNALTGRGASPASYTTEANLNIPLRELWLIIAL